jgi:hypothetical protein
LEMKQGLLSVSLQTERLSKIIMGLSQIVQVSIDHTQIIIKFLSLRTEL